MTHCPFSYTYAGYATAPSGQISTTFGSGGHRPSAPDAPVDPFTVHVDALVDGLTLHVDPFQPDAVPPT
jgi:hypothetical protein